MLVIGSGSERLANRKAGKTRRARLNSEMRHINSFYKRFESFSEHHGVMLPN